MYAKAALTLQKLIDSAFLSFTERLKGVLLHINAFLFLLHFLAYMEKFCKVPTEIVIQQGLSYLTQWVTSDSCLDKIQAAPLQFAFCKRI